MKRILALLIVFIPVFLAALGIKLMRDMLFGVLFAPIPFLWLQFFLGLLLFIIGLSFMSGFILYRDRKRNKVQWKFQHKNKETN